MIHLLSDSGREKATTRFLLKTIDLKSREEELFLVSAFDQTDAWKALKRLHPTKMVCVEGSTDLKGEICPIR